MYEIYILDYGNIFSVKGEMVFGYNVKYWDHCMMLGPQLRELLKWPRPLPLEEERVRLLHEVTYVVLTEVSEFVWTLVVFKIL